MRATCVFASYQAKSWRMDSWQCGKTPQWKVLPKAVNSITKVENELTENTGWGVTFPGRIEERNTFSSLRLFHASPGPQNGSRKHFFRKSHSLSSFLLTAVAWSSKLVKARSILFQAGIHHAGWHFHCLHGANVFESHILRAYLR